MRLLWVLSLVLTACVAQVTPLDEGQPDEDQDDDELPSPPGPLGPQPDARPDLPDDDPPDDDPPDNDPPDPPPPPADDVLAVLDVHGMDIWAQYLPEDAAITVTHNGKRILPEGFPIGRVELREAGDYVVTLSARYHDPLEARVQYDGSGKLTGAKVIVLDVDRTSGILLTHALEDGVAVHRLFLGLRHRYFAASGRPARHGNKLALLMNGEEAWTQVKRDLEAARSTIHLTTWWLDSTFELVRDHAYHSPDTRRRNTILSVLERSAAWKRVLVGQLLGQDGVVSWVTSDDAVRAHGRQRDDRFDFMGQANETAGIFLFAIENIGWAERVRSAVPALAGAGIKADPTHGVEIRLPSREIDLTDWPVNFQVNHASWHQKFITIDGKVALVGGMNLTKEDWDTSAHRVFDPRRMPFDASQADRQRVADKEALPPTPPAKDYMMRVEGPSAQDVDDVFQLRWDLAIEEAVEFSENATAFEPVRGAAAAGGVQAQITTTMPDPLWEHSIAESWMNAVAQAEDYIYIEDQYFRAPMLNDAILRRMRQVPSLKLVVLTRPVGEWVDVGCAWTARSHALFAAEFPTRYRMLQLRAFDTTETWGFDETESRYVDMYLHAKMLVIDDLFMSVGSANKNNRGMIYEGEMNVAVVDPTWVRAARRRMLASLMPGLTPTDDVEVWFDQLGQCAEWNDYVLAGWESEGHDLDLDGDALPERYSPFGTVHTLDVPLLEECLLEDIGPDMT